MAEKILFVDDEPNLLEALRRMLRRRFQLEFAVGGSEALATLGKKGPFAVVVSDLRMPGMDGVRLLSAVRERAPDAVRIMLTGQADMEASVAAVNEGNIFRFLMKPCPVPVLVKALEDALEQHRLVTAEKELLEQTLRGSVRVMSEVLSLANPAAFGQASRMRRYVRHIASTLGLEPRWQFDLAAMLSQLGCVSLPPGTLEKAYVGSTLDAGEQEMIARYPRIGAEMLSRIPRLGPVADMIAGQQRACGAEWAATPASQRTSRQVGAQLLHVCHDFDQLLVRGQTPPRARRELAAQPEVYAPDYVEALRSLELAGERTVFRRVAIEELTTGMILQQDLRTEGGILLVPRGQKVTELLIHRLLNFAREGQLPKGVTVEMVRTTPEP